MKKLSIAIAIACLAVGAVAAVAYASLPTVGSTVTIQILRGPSDTFYGQVESQESACAARARSRSRRSRRARTR